MPSRRDFLKQTGGLVLASGGVWADRATRCAADSVLGPAGTSGGNAVLVDPRGVARQGAADQEDLAAAQFRNAGQLFQ